LDPVFRQPLPPNPTGFNIQDQLGRLVLASDIVVPELDPRGNPSAARYESWRKANHSRIGIPSNTYSIKGRGMVACLSTLERRFLSYCEMNPMVLEIRSQYPEWDTNKSTAALDADKRLLETDIMTVDFVLTLQVPRSRKVRYHAISCKRYEDLQKESTSRRHAREIRRLGLWGCTHEIFTEYSFTKIQDKNNQRLLQYMLHTENIYDHARPAYQLANIIRRAKGAGDLDQLITWAAKQLGFDRDMGYRLFGIAHFIGYMVCDHTKELLPETKMEFTEENRHFLPRLDVNLLPMSRT
jgi:hypothetical protein